MKTSILSVILVLLTLIIFSGCAKKSDSSSDSTSSTSSTSSSTEGYKRESMPANTTVSLPSTLTGKASASSRTAYASLDNSMGVMQSQNSVLFMKAILAIAEYEMTFFDAAISQSKMSVGNCYAANEVKVTFTEGMLQAMKDVYSKIDSEMSTSQLSKYSAMVGTQISNDFPVSYVTTSTGGFEKLITKGSDGATCSGTAVSSIRELIMWTDDRNKLQYTFDVAPSGDALFGTLAYDTTTKTSSFDIYLKSSSTEFLMSSNFTECTSSDNDCVKFRFSMGSASFKIETRGRADDNGEDMHSRNIFRAHLIFG